MPEHDACPECGSEELHYLGSYNVECRDCQHGWNLRDQHGLSRTHCEACYHTLSWGCGHETHHEVEALRHYATPEHRAGACWHFDHDDCKPGTCKLAQFPRIPGYMPFVKHADAPAFFANIEARHADA